MSEIAARAFFSKAGYSRGYFEKANFRNRHEKKNPPSKPDNCMMNIHVIGVFSGC